MNNRPKKAQCSAPKCLNTTENRPDLTFFAFPTNMKRCSQWVERTRRVDLSSKSTHYLHTTHRLCAEHFERSQFRSDSKLCLIGNAMPTIFEDPDDPEPVTLTTPATSQPTSGSPPQPSSSAGHDPTPPSDPPSDASPSPTQPSSSSASDGQATEPGGEKETTQNKQKKKSNLPKKPKPPYKPQTPYLAYSSKVWEEVVAANKNLKPSEVGRIVLTMWEEVPVAEKKLYVTEYDSKLVEYDKALEAYHNSPAYQEYMAARNKANPSAKQPSSSSSARNKQKKKPIPKKPKSPNKPPFPYMLYFAEVWDHVKFSNSALKMEQVKKIVKHMWEELPLTDKKYYLDKYEMKTKEYDKELEDYRNSPAYKTYQEYLATRKRKPAITLAPGVGPKSSGAQSTSTTSTLSKSDVSHQPATSSSAKPLSSSMGDQEANGVEQEEEVIKVNQKAQNTKDHLPRKPKAPFQPVEPFIKYSAKMWDQVKAANSNLSMWEIDKIIHNNWNHLSTAERQPYWDEYAIEKAEYNKAMEAYHTSPAYQEYIAAKNRGEVSASKGGVTPVENISSQPGPTGLSATATMSRAAAPVASRLSAVFVPAAPFTNRLSSATLPAAPVPNRLSAATVPAAPSYINTHPLPVPLLTSLSVPAAEPPIGTFPSVPLPPLPHVPTVRQFPVNTSISSGSLPAHRSAPSTSLVPPAALTGTQERSSKRRRIDNEASHQTSHLDQIVEVLREQNVLFERTVSKFMQMGQEKQQQCFKMQQEQQDMWCKMQQQQFRQMLQLQRQMREVMQTQAQQQDCLKKLLQGIDKRK